MNKISNSTNAKIILLGVLLIFFCTTQWIGWTIADEVFTWGANVAFLIICAFLISTNYFSLQIRMNEAIILLDVFSKRSRALFQGFHFILPWEEIQYKVDLEAKISSDLKEVFPTTDGSVEVEVTFISKPDSGEGESEYERSNKMINHVKFKNEAIKGMLESEVKKQLREYFSKLSSKEAKNSQSVDIFKKDSFIELENMLAIKIISIAIKNVSYNEEMQRALNSIMTAKTIAELKQVLIDGGYSSTQAEELAPLLNKDINLRKKIFDINFKLNKNH